MLCVFPFKLIYFPLVLALRYRIKADMQCFFLQLHHSAILSFFLSGTIKECWGDRSVVCSTHLYQIWKYPRWSALCQISSHQSFSNIRPAHIEGKKQIFGSHSAYNLMPSLIHLNIMLSYLWTWKSRFDPVVASQQALELCVGDKNSVNDNFWV